MNKKGAELSMNIIIITILVVIVLVIMAVFFTGGMASLTKKISNIFSGQLTDISEATTKCNAYCVNYQNQNSDIIKSSMMDNFCNGKFDVDLNGDGKITADEQGKTCNTLGISCGITCG
ncbi:MAG: hypothetical protein PHF86_09165 [Candidatus Nanoarchaeia archaeon]|nr:hypothetical protein [Candidatus Nanoarchaeia archaeon]